MNFKYTEKDVRARIWTNPGGVAERAQTMAAIPETLEIRGQTYNVVDLFCRVTRPSSIWLQNPHETPQAQVARTGRPNKYDQAAWTWMRHSTPEEIQVQYGISIAYARQLKKSSMQHDLP